MKDKRKSGKQSLRPEEKGDDLPVHRNQYRHTIDEIDKEILELIQRRLAAAKKIGKIKRRKGSRVIDPRRETEVLQRLLRLNAGGLLSDAALLKVFTPIICASREIQNLSSVEGFEPAEVDNYAILGNPISHSLSPVMHNAAFAASGYHGVYIALKSENIGDAIAALKAMNFKGASITIPFKVDVMPYLDGLDDMAGMIRAVNTVINKDGRLFGCNTDYLGAVRALAEKTTIRGKEVVIVGAGGAARAIAFGMAAEGGHVTIVNRSQEAGEKLAGDLKVEFVPLVEIKKLKSHILINATPIGMAPDVESIPVPEDVLNKDMVVMDIVYNPLRTMLLQKAEEIGCIVVDGVSMLVYQGACQFELWTGLKAPVALMRMAVLAALGARQSNKPKVK